MKSNEKKIIYLFSLTTNFKPSSLKDFNISNMFKRKFSMRSNKEKVICRNFFLFLILLKYNKKNPSSRSSFFIKPLKKNLQTILRAPYRHKLTRHQITLIRYNIIFKFTFNSKGLVKAKSYNDVNKVMKELSIYNNWVESNLISNYKIKFKFDFNYDNNFIIINFTKNKKQ